MGTFQKSDGTRIKKSVLDRRVAKAKDEYSEEFVEEHGYIFCEHCGKNEYGCPGISRSHIISVDECQKMGKAELAYSKKNFDHAGNSCHLEFESHDHDFRQGWFYAKQEKITYQEYKKSRQ